MVGVGKVLDIFFIDMLVYVSIGVFVLLFISILFICVFKEVVFEMFMVGSIWKYVK